MKGFWAFCFSLLACCAAQGASGAPGEIVLFNGTSSAGKSSLAEVVVQQSKAKFEVVSFDDVYHPYRKDHGITRFTGQQYQDFLGALYRQAKAQADAGHNVIIDTVEFDAGYDRYCEILNCSNVIKAIVYCPLDQILKRIDKRNSAPASSGHRPVLLSFQQFLQMYKNQSERVGFTDTNAPLLPRRFYQLVEP